MKVSKIVGVLFCSESDSRVYLNCIDSNPTPVDTLNFCIFVSVVVFPSVPYSLNILDPLCAASNFTFVPTGISAVTCIPLMNFGSAYCPRLNTCVVSVPFLAYALISPLCRLSCDNYARCTIDSTIYFFYKWMRISIHH